jgi:ADP-heptose:LPS heptosyltransferase
VLAEDQPIGMLAALFERARLVLGVDSGPLHLATAVGTPTVRLYGPTSAAIFGPWGPSSAHVALTSELACAPCGRLDYRPDELAAHPCVRLIAPAAVISAAQTVLRVPPETRLISEHPTAEQREGVAAS